MHQNYKLLPCTLSETRLASISAVSALSRINKIVLSVRSDFLCLCSDFLLLLLCSHHHHIRSCYPCSHFGSSFSPEQSILVSCNENTPTVCDKQSGCRFHSGAGLSLRDHKTVTCPRRICVPLYWSLIRKHR